MIKAEIFMEDTQSFRKVDEELMALVERVINHTLAYEEFERKCEVSVLFVDNEQIKEINNDFRQIDAPTDVLSFPMLTFDNKRVIDDAGDSYLGTLVLGDIIVSLERAAAQADEYGHSFERELGFLVCHSTLHLLGYDHETEDERADMRSREEAVLAQLELTR